MSGSEAAATIDAFAFVAKRARIRPIALLFSTRTAVETLPGGGGYGERC